MAHQPIEKMTVHELESRMDWHLGLAAWYRRMDQPSAAREFDKLAILYSNELARRAVS